ncbi:MAG: hypothetical protein ABSC05_20275 [Candidatus Solibacter sp.]|jgi:hypothetical protein
MSTDFAATRLQSQVNGWNELVQADYLAVFDYWGQRALAERAGSRNLPKPPNAFVAGFFTDSMNPLAPSAYPETGSEPGCAMPAVRPSIKPTPLYIGYSYARVA